MKTHPQSIERRDFLKSALATAAFAGMLGPKTGAAGATGAAAVVARPDAGGRTDVNVSLFQWPCRRLPLDRTEKLVAKLRHHRFTQAWAGSFEGILHRDIGAVNERLTDECNRIGGGLLVPFGSVNLALPAWEEDVRRCHEKFKMPGIRLHPNYHGYTLADPRFARLLAMAAERNLLVQLVVLMEDIRTQSKLMRVPDTDVTSLAEVMPKVPGARVLLLNSKGPVQRQGDTVTAIPGVYHDIARLESSGEVARAMRALPRGTILFGTHAPFFIFESSLIKIDEASLDPAEVQALLTENPRALLQKA